MTRDDDTYTEDVSDTDFAQYEYDAYTVREELDDQDRADDLAAAPSLVVPFHSDAHGLLELGADALLFIMAYGHCLTVPDAVLPFAEKVGIIAIARRDTAAAILRDVNKALDLIAWTIRYRATLALVPAMSLPIPEPERPNEGPMAPLLPRPIVRPPSGQKQEVQF